MSSKIQENTQTRFKEYDQDQIVEVPVLVKDAVKENMLVQIVDEVVESIDISKLSAFYSKKGCPAYHPRMMLKVWIYGFCNKVYTCRVLESKLREDLGFIYLSGNQRPCFKTLSGFRSSRMKGMVDEVFKELLLYLLERGYIDLEDLYVDGTMMEANANKYKINWAKNTARWKAAAQERVEGFLKQAEELQAQEDEEYGNNGLAKYQGQEQISVELDSASLQGRIASINQKAEELADKKRKRKLKSISNKVSKEAQKIAKYEQQEKALAGRNSYSKTDQDATALRMKDDSLKPGYNVQITTSNQFILNTSVHATAADSATFESHMSQLGQYAEGMVPGVWRPAVTTDAGYGSEEAYAFLESKNWTGYVKYFTWHREHTGQIAKQPYRRENWHWDSQGGYFICPQGRKLYLAEEFDKKTKTGYTRHVHVYECESCQGCPAFKQCRRDTAPPDSNRRLWISWKLEAYKEKAKTLLASEQGKAKRAQRGVDVETPFGNIKHNRGYRRFLLRGKDKVYIEACLLSISHNLIKVECDVTGKWEEHYARRRAKAAEKKEKRA
jgi:transposase